MEPGCRKGPPFPVRKTPSAPVSERGCNPRDRCPIHHALRWLGPDAARDRRVVLILKRNLPDAVKRDLVRNGRDLPGWALPLARAIATERIAA